MSKSKSRRLARKTGSSDLFSLSLEGSVPKNDLQDQLQLIVKITAQKFTAENLRDFIKIIRAYKTDPVVVEDVSVLTGYGKSYSFKLLTQIEKAFPTKESLVHLWMDLRIREEVRQQLEIESRPKSQLK